MTPVPQMRNGSPIVSRNAATFRHRLVLCERSGVCAMLQILQEEREMGCSEIDDIRALLSSKPRPVGWQQRRQRIEEVGSAWPAADDIDRVQVDIAGMPGEWSIAPGSDASRVLLY